MTINEDFFDDINSDDIDMDISVYDDNQMTPSYSKYRYTLTACIPEKYVQNFSKTYFEKVLDWFIYIEYAVDYSVDKHIIVYFNHSLTTLKQYLDFILCLYNATKQMIDEWLCDSNDDYDIVDAAGIYMPTIIERYTNPSELCYTDTTEAKRTLRNFVTVLNDGNQPFSLTEDYNYLFNIILKDNAARAENEIEDKFMLPKSKDISLRNRIIIWSSYEKIQEMLTKYLNIDKDLTTKEVSVVECTFNKNTETGCDFNIIQMDTKNPDFMTAISGFDNWKKLRRVRFFEIYPKYCPIYIDYEKHENIILVPFGQILGKDRETVSMYYIKIMYETSSRYTYNNSLNFLQLLLEKMQIV